ncbi:MAG: N-acetylmuramoyl-L-alanine amidase [Bacteroidales bacterium]|jgi:N-acetylmuramoyl-L-alanine amidase
MKRKFKTLFSLAITLLMSYNSFAQDNLRFKIVRGKTDTVNSRSHFIIGVAPLGAEIFINGMKVKQYSTGSFGTQMMLQEGDNPVEIKVYSGSEEMTDSFSVYYKQSSLREVRDVPFFKYPVVVTKKGAYFNSSPGGDRLGGAKMNFLAEGIKMELLGVEGNLYKVKLSDNRSAYLPSHYADLLPVGEMPAFSVSSSWSVVNSGKYDKVRIALENRQPYIIYRNPQPNQLVVEIHGTVNNSNWITQYRNLKSIDYVHLNQISSDVLQVVIGLKEKFSWGYNVDYVGNGLEISIKNTPEVLYSRSKRPFAGLTIGLDAGHGGTSSGAVSPSGIKEKDLNLDMVLSLKELIESNGGKVVLSRSEDIDVSMQERVDIFRNANIDIMVSVHCNAGGNPLQPMGTSTYYRHIEYRPLAKGILDRLMELNVGEFGLIGNFNFSLNAPTDFPTVLVETLFMSSLPDEELLASPEFRRDMMEKVAAGLEDYIGDVRESLK